MKNKALTWRRASKHALQIAKQLHVTEVSVDGVLGERGNGRIVTMVLLVYQKDSIAVEATGVSYLHPDDFKKGMLNARGYELAKERAQIILGMRLLALTNAGYEKYVKRAVLSGTVHGYMNRAAFRTAYSNRPNIPVGA